MDIFDRIKQDHDKYRELFERAVSSAESDPEQSALLYREIYTEVTAHHITEEHTLFYALAQHDKAKRITHEGFEEHRAIDAFLEYLENADRNVRWPAKIAVLRELTEHHLDEEEEDMFESGREVLLDSELEGLLTQFEARKKEELSKFGGS